MIMLHEIEPSLGQGPQGALDDLSNEDHGYRGQVPGCHLRPLSEPRSRSLDAERNATKYSFESPEIGATIHGRPIVTKASSRAAGARTTPTPPTTRNGRESVRSRLVTLVPAKVGVTAPLVD